MSTATATLPAPVVNDMGPLLHIGPSAPVYVGQAALCGHRSPDGVQRGWYRPGSGRICRECERIADERYGRMS